MISRVRYDTTYFVLSLRDRHPLATVWRMRSCNITRSSTRKNIRTGLVYRHKGFYSPGVLTSFKLYLDYTSFAILQNLEMWWLVIRLFAFPYSLTEARCWQESRETRSREHPRRGVGRKIGKIGIENIQTLWCWTVVVSYWYTCFLLFRWRVGNNRAHAFEVRSLHYYLVYHFFQYVLIMKITKLGESRENVDVTFTMLSLARKKR